jgi:hypothetical protein
MGVDYLPLKVEPIRAIGAGTIVAVGSWGMYGPWFDYKLASGQFAGKCIYVAEHIGSILPPGTRFNAGDPLATAYPGPYWTEWGWAKGLDAPAVTWAECGCTEQDNVNPGGRAFARFLRSLGAKTEQDRTRADVCGGVVLMRREISPSSPRRQRSSGGLLARRLAVTVAAIALLAAAEIAATLSATAALGPGVTRRAPLRETVAPPPDPGEPHLPRDAPTPLAPREAAVRFVRDYMLWRDGQLTALPVEDATQRVISMLERQRTHCQLSASTA